MTAELTTILSAPDRQALKQAKDLARDFLDAHHFRRFL